MLEIPNSNRHNKQQMTQTTQENPAKVLTYAHFYLIDHLISTLYIVFFGVTWYVYTPHDGRRVANSDAQKAILEGAGAANGGMVDEHERARMALQVWNDEKGFSTTVLVLGWLIKVCNSVHRQNTTIFQSIPPYLTMTILSQIYFIAILYSYAIHLRRGTFRALLASQQASASSKTTTSSTRPATGSSSSNGYAYSHLRNSSLASNGQEVVWEGAHDDASLDSPMAGDDSNRNSR